MRYTTKITIDLPREQVIEKLDNLDNIKHWQRGLVSATPISGEPGEEGAKMKLEYKMGKREIEMVETVIKRNFPDELHLTYTAPGVYNLQKNYLRAVDENTTEWIVETEFKFSTVMMKVMGFLMPGAFKKQSRQYAEDFKKFAEEGVSVLERP